MRWWRARPCSIGAALILAGCSSSPYAEVHHVKAHLPAPAGTGRLGLVEQFLAKAIHEEQAHPLAAMGDCLVALKDASDELKRTPNDPIALRDYNFGVSRVFQIIHDTNFDAWSRPVNVPTAEGMFILTRKPDPRPEWNPALYDFTPADQFAGRMS